MARPEAKNWVWTLNNPQSEEDHLIPSPEDYDYQIIGKETGEQGTDHYQAYTCFKKKIRLTALKKKYSQRIHWEIMKGTPQQASDYCKKEGDWKEEGTLPQSQTQAAGIKRKADYETAHQLAIEGKFNEIDPALKFRHAKNIIQIHAWHIAGTINTTELSEPQTIWIHGPPGVGKSTWARSTFPNFYEKPKDMWWDGYTGQPYVIIEEFSPDTCRRMDISYVKQIFDKFPFHAAIKGGSIGQIRPRVVVVTSNYTIEECFKQQVDQQSILRRCKVIYKDELSDVVENPFPTDST